MNTGRATGRALPNFLVAGAPKAGTTSLYHYLGAHPQIFLPEKKELHYFSYEYLLRNTNGPGDKEALQGLCSTRESYLRCFARVRQEKAIGDISPSYLYFHQCAARIKRDLGEGTRIVIMLRHPAKRAFSNYVHMVRHAREPLSFFDALNAEEERMRKGWGDFWRYKQHSLYYRNVKHYLDVFGPANVKIVLQDDFSHDTVKTLQGILRFLDVEDAFVPPNIDVVFGAGGIPKHRLLFELLEKPNLFKTAARRLLPELLAVRLRRIQAGILSLNSRKDAAMDDKSIELLQAHFKEDIEKLEELLQEDLEAWKSV